LSIFVAKSGEDLQKEEHVDNEFLWNLKLLSEVSPLCSVVMLHFVTVC